jgi:hypothetical protein
MALTTRAHPSAMVGLAFGQHSSMTTEAAVI